MLTSVAQVAAERGLAVAGARIHRPGVIFPYLDNDIGSYPHLDAYAALARQELGVKLRISTVGYSRHATHLAVMHQRLVTEYADVFEGVRLSITPYTAGYLGTGELSRHEYVQDLAAALATYRPLLEHLGHGAATAACELRFAPLVGIHDLLDTHINGRHVLACGPHLLIARQPGEQPLPETVIDHLDERTQPVYSRPGAPYLHLTCHDHERAELAELVTAALAGTLNRPHQARLVRLHHFSNGDGPYYAADPDFHPDGRFTAPHQYPRTDQRKASGYTDATRWYLNTLLAYKSARGLQRRDEFPDATQGDVQAVLAALSAQADTLADYDSAAAEHLREQIYPQVAAYAHALELAGLPPAAFFSPRFSIDTGQIVNQGRAQGLFRGLAATNGEPMTPREERGFGYASLSSARGPIWRITPLPLTGTRTLQIAVTGKKNPATTTPSLLVQELDPCHLSPTMRATGCRLRSHTLTLPDGALEHLTLQQGRAGYALPGLAATT